MGFVSKLVGSVTGANKQADAIEGAANQQAAAVRDSAEKAAKAAREAAAQTARTQEAAVARSAAESAASDLMDTPLENADVQLDTTSTESASGALKKRRQTFGVGSSATGVNI